LRILILLLMTANLGFWAWANWIRAAPAPATRYDGPGIALLRELPADSPLRASPPQAATVTAEPAPAAAASAPVPAVADPAAAAGAAPAGTIAAVPTNLRCVAIGPFAQADVAAAAEATLAAAGIVANRFVGEDEIWDGYWVYIERIESREQAREMLAAITTAGMADAYMIPDSDSGILISLGVFSEITRAFAQAEQVDALDFEATIADRMRTAETTWLQMQVADGTDVLGLLRRPGQISRLEQQNCDTAGE
jgi:hypothetical protein